MPVMVYDEDVPDDRRWRWSTDVPASWGQTSPAILSDRIEAVLTRNGVRWQERAPEFAIIVGAENVTILSNADDDPGTLFAGMTELPPTEVEVASAEARERMTAYTAAVAAGEPITTERLGRALADMFLIGSTEQ